MDSPPFGEKISFLEIIIHPEVNPSRLLGVTAKYRQKIGEIAIFRRENSTLNL